MVGLKKPLSSKIKEWIWQHNNAEIGEALTLTNRKYEEIRHKINRMCNESTPYLRKWFSGSNLSKALAIEMENQGLPFQPTKTVN